jgi:hypothetical protein
VLVIFPLLWINTWENQLKRRKGSFDSYFQSIVAWLHCSGAEQSCWEQWLTSVIPATGEGSRGLRFEVCPGKRL